MMSFVQHVGRFLGFETNKTSHIERLVSGVATFFAISVVAFVTKLSLAHEVHILFFASAAASAFLVFTLPHGALSQPWPVLAGQGLACVVGGVLGGYFGNSLTTAAVAVGATIILMHYLGCLHPPGGATAFYFVTNWPQASGYHAVGVFMINIAIIVCLALLINNVFYWRRYPSYWFNKKAASSPEPVIEHFGVEDLHQVLQQQDTFIDVSLSELQSIYDSAINVARERVRVGHRKSHEPTVKSGLMVITKKEIT